MDIEVYLREVTRRIAATFDPERIILFGSYAYGIPTSDSDIDIMVIMQTSEMPHKRAVPIRRLLRDIGMPKDIVVRTPEEFERFKDIVGTVIYPAAHRGRVLYERQ
ncbi:DNA polymerase subunit beta [Candidatus Magnetobacterium bavaricum]|uniref:DNA polymerase subunit beta n=1 Tax=Candidatus Magnetobacterium bavaricum TaxID=29290 RepID=A0A0F3GIK8_9BACT|nr:DNA polymerase subunit beta [Candidatus Magnetobacterium bavaricum]